MMNKLIGFFFLSVALLLSACGDDNNNNSSPAINESSNQQTFNWKMVTTWPANFPIFQEGAEKFADDLAKMSGGRLAIRVYAGNELVPPLQVFDAVSQGQIEMGHGAAYYWAGKVPEAQFFSSVPFGMTAKGMNAWLYNGGGLALWNEVYEPFNLIALPMGNTGIQMGGWFNKPIDSLDDIKGLRMRIPGLGGKVFKKAGGNPILMAGSEIYTALERGTLDATEWVSPFHDLRLGLNRAAQFYYYPGWHEPGTVFELMINRGKWSELPADLQKMVEIAAAATSEWIYAQMEFHNQAALATLREKKTVEIRPFPDDVLKELRRLTHLTLNEEAAQNANFKRVYDAYEAFRASYKDWDEISAKAYQRSLELGD